MGGDPWYIVTAFDGDLPAALRRAQLEALREGSFEHRADAPTPTSIESAREQAAESGTASIIDVRELGSAPGFLVAGPFAEDHLEEMFGSSHPLRADVMQALDELFEYLDRGEAAYVLLYDERGQPGEVLFAGYSVD